MRIAVNAISATAGGAKTYLVNLARTLPAQGDHEYLLYIPAAAQAELAGALPPRFQLRQVPWAERGYLARLLWEQWTLPRAARRWSADVLLCVGNFCPLRSPVPVLLLSRNALYFTPGYLRDLLERRHYLWAVQHLLMTRLAIRSAQAARLTVTPTRAMAEMILSAGAGPPPRLLAIPFGLPCWPSADGRLPPAPPPPPFRLLVVSHYNYFRSFETVFRALARLRAAGDRFELILSTHLRPGLRLGGYDTTLAWRLLGRLGLRDAVTLLGPVEYDDLPRLYHSAHAVLCPSYAESFGQTVLEAMAMGVPVVASDIAAHREVGGDAALYFTPEDPEMLAACCRRLWSDPELGSRLRTAGRERAGAFSWHRHFEQLWAAAEEAATN